MGKTPILRKSISLVTRKVWVIMKESVVTTLSCVPFNLK